jgi:hypothetical protein
MQNLKEWTILLYANGNNELEPEMWQSKLDAEKVGSDTNVNVVIQISREEKQLVKIIRPFCRLPESPEDWTGTRRYYVLKGHSDLINNHGKLNMAHPLTLYEFIKWGMKKYPAKKYMLILGGHGYQFVGAMTDYSQDTPYIMGIPAMSKAINMACHESGNKIDILVLDICFFNFIEVIYQLGKDEDSHIQTVLTYVLNGPLQGLPYNTLIHLAQDNVNYTSFELINRIISELNLDLVAFELNHQKLYLLKRLFDLLAQSFLMLYPHEENINALINDTCQEETCMQIARNIERAVTSIIVDYKTITQPSALLNVCNYPTTNPDVLSCYYELAFAQNNYWTYLLSNKTIDIHQFPPANQHLKPKVLTPKAIYSYISIMNPLLNQQDVAEIYNNLIKYKKWNTPS